MPRFLQGALLAFAGYFDASFSSGLLLILIHNEWGKPMAVEILGLGFVAQAVFWIPILILSGLICRKSGLRKTFGLVLAAFFVTLLAVVGFFGVFMNY
jgi:hypothetical protein